MYPVIFGRETIMAMIRFGDGGIATVPVEMLKNDVKMELAKNPKKVPEDFLLAMIKDVIIEKGIDGYFRTPDCILVEELASNHDTPPSIISALVERYGNTYILTSIAKNPATPIEILWKIFSERKTWDPIEALAENPATPEKMIKKILSLAYNGLTYRLLSEEREFRVNIIEKILFNPSSGSKIKIDILDHYYFKPDKGCDNQKDLAWKKHIRDRLCASDETSKDVIFYLMDSSNLELIAINSNSDEEIIEKVYNIQEQRFQKGSTKVLVALLAANPRTPIKILEEISKRSGIIGHIAQNNLKCRKS